MDNVLEKPFWGKLYRFFNQHTLLCLTILLAILSFVIYRDFLLGIKYYIPMQDIGSDAYYQSYAGVNFISDYIRTDGLPTWGFNYGLGQSVYPVLGDPFRLVVVLLGEEAIPYMTGLMQFLKPIAAGLFFYLYLYKVIKSKKAAFIFAVMYAFCGAMIIRGSWVRFSSEVVWIAFLLWAVESYLLDGNWKLLPIAVALLGISLPAYSTLLYIVLFFVYFLIRLYSEKGSLEKKTGKTIVQYIGLYALGIAIAAMIVIPSIYSSFNGARVSGDLAPASTQITNTVQPVINGDIGFTTYFMTLGMDALGTGYAYTGYSLYMEGPLFYCGILAVLLLPQAFLIANKRKRNGMLILYAICLMYIFFPMVRYAAGGFITHNYRDSSFFIVVIMLYVSANVFAEVIAPRKMNLPLFGGTVGIIVGLGVIGVLRADIYRFTFNYVVLLCMAIFVVLYSVLLLLHQKKQWRFLLIGIAAVVCVEACLFANFSINGADRDYMTPSVTQSGRDFFTGEEKAIAAIKEEDPDFYRMEMDFQRWLISDPLYNNYYGLRTYSMMPKSTVAFLNVMKTGLLVEKEEGKRPPNVNISRGFVERGTLTTFLGMRYILSYDSQAWFPGYELVGEKNGFYIYKNQNALSVGNVFDHYMVKEDFLTLDSLEKDVALTQACIVDDERQILNGMTRMYPDDISKQFIKLRPGKGGVTADCAGMNILSGNPAEDIVFEIEPDTQQAYIDLQFTEPVNVAGVSFLINSETQTEDARISINSSLHTVDETRGISYAIYDTYQNIVVSVMENDVTTLRIGLGNTVGEYEIENISVIASTKKMRDTDYDKALQKLQETGLQVSEHSQKKIKGKIDVKQDGMLVLSIPYDSGWRIKVDGQPQPTEIVDVGLTGIRLGSGYHDIEAEYVQPGLYPSIAISLLGIGIYVILLLYEKMKKSKLS